MKRQAKCPWLKNYCSITIVHIWWNSIHSIIVKPTGYAFFPSCRLVLGLPEPSAGPRSSDHSCTRVFVFLLKVVLTLHSDVNESKLFRNSNCPTNLECQRLEKSIFQIELRQLEFKFSTLFLSLVSVWLSYWAQWF